MGTNLKIGGRVRPIRLKYRFTSEECFSFLLGLIWADDILLNYVRAVLLRIPYVYAYREHIMAILFLVALIPALPYMVKRIHPWVLVGFLSMASVYFLNMLLFPQNKEALDENLVPFLFKSLPLLFIGASMDLKKHHRMLYLISMLSVIIRFVHLLLDPTNNVDGDMHSSYLLLPHVCLVIAGTLSERNLLNLAASILGIFSIISFGSRGPILCILFLVAIYMILYSKINKHIWMFITVLVLLICFVFFYETIVQLILELIQRMGMSTRIISMLISGDIASSSGRDVIQGKLMEAVSDNWFGYGIAADRTLVDYYSHNILIELWVSYGVVLGTILFGWAMSILIKIMIPRKAENTEVVTVSIALFSSTVIKLFLSSSYLQEPLLFLLLGLAIAENNKRKRTATGIV